MSTYLLTGLVAALLLFASVVAHEFGHALVAQAEGIPVKRITLCIFGGIASLERAPGTPGADCKIALVGPIVSGIIGGTSWMVGLALLAPSPLAGELITYLGAANLLLAGFNLIPGFPLDGGRCLNRKRQTSAFAIGSVNHVVSTSTQQPSTSAWAGRGHTRPG